jgi:hypothetical protein
MNNIIEQFDARFGYNVAKFLKDKRFVYGELPFSTWNSVGSAIACYLIVIYSLRWLMKDVSLLSLLFIDNLNHHFII